MLKALKDMTIPNQVAKRTLGIIIWVLQVVGLAFFMQTLWFHLRSCCEVVKVVRETGDLHHRLSTQGNINGRTTRQGYWYASQALLVHEMEILLQGTKLEWQGLVMVVHGLIGSGLSLSLLASGMSISVFYGNLLA